MLFRKLMTVCCVADIYMIYVYVCVCVREFSSIKQSGIWSKQIAWKDYRTRHVTSE